MRVIIMGCGRVGAELASNLDADGHEVTVLDINSAAFRRLAEGFSGRTVIGNGVDVDVLRRNGIEHAEAFVAVTQGDNRNVMAAQIAKEVFSVPRVVSRIYDPLREEMYRALGLRTISPTKVGAQLLRDALEEAPAGDGA